MNPEDLNATPDKVLAPYIFGGKDSDEPQKGTMTVNSLLSFNCAAYSGRRVLAKWQNPKAAKGRPYSGVYIRYSTGGYPGKTGGTQIYKGPGNNTASGGQSQAYLDLPALNTTYYLSCIPYVTCSVGEMTGDVINATVRTSAELNVTIKGTQNYTVPAGYTKMDAFLVGGGGGGQSNGIGGPQPGGGGGGGYTATKTVISVSGGQVLNMTVGAGGKMAGGTSSIVRSTVTLASVSGGKYGNGVEGGAGGSGGGSSASISSGASGGDGGSDGSNGKGYRSGSSGGKGQGTTTREWGSPGGTFYAGGGGAGCRDTGNASRSPGVGGAGGGGAGGHWGNGASGSANTGGGGGGAPWDDDYNRSGGTGGSGVILIKLY